MSVVVQRSGSLPSSDMVAELRRKMECFHPFSGARSLFNANNMMVAVFFTSLIERGHHDKNDHKFSSSRNFKLICVL